MNPTLKIRNYLKALEQKHSMKRRLVTAIPYWVAAAATGCIAVAYAKMFLLVESWAMDLTQVLGYWLLLVSPLVFIVSWALIHYLAPQAGGSGIPQLLVASELAPQRPEVVGRFLGFRIIPVKMLSSLITCLGGGAIGREGPTLQIAGSVFVQIRRIVPKSWGQPSIGSMILAGGGAGLAAAFNTPLGGIVYVIEELSKDHLSKFRTALLQSVIIAGLVAQLFLGSYLYLGYPAFGSIDQHAVLGAFAVGLSVGIAGALFGSGLKWVVILRERFSKTWMKVASAAASGLLMAALILLCGNSSLGSGKDQIMELLFRHEAMGLATGFSRFVGPIITYAQGGAGGIFAPCLSSGAILASYFKTLIPISTPLLAVLGMVAFLAAVTHTPFTSFVLVLEMTNGNAALFPMMVAGSLAYAVSKMISPHSFYEFVQHRQLAALEAQLSPHVDADLIDRD